MSGTPQTASPATLSGWIEAFAYNLAIALMSLAYAVAIRSGAHVITFIFYSMTVGAIGLLMVKGPGRDAMQIAASPISWLVGAGIIGMEVFYFIVLRYMPPADGSLIIRSSIPLSLIIGLVFFGRRVTPLGWLGGLLVLSGVLLIMLGLELPAQLGGLLAALICGVIINVRSYATEMHPWNRRADTVPEKMRVTGVVVMTTALAGLILWGTLTLLLANGIVPPSPLIPEPYHWTHLPTIGLAVLVGGVIYSAMQYLGFSSVVKIGSSNFIASAAFTPVMTLGVQWLAESTGLIDFGGFDWRLVPSIALAIIGVLIIVWAARRQRIGDKA